MKKKSFPIRSILILFIALFLSCEEGLDRITVDSVIYLTQYGVSEQIVPLGESTVELGVYRSGINQEEGDIMVTLDIDQDSLVGFLSTNPGYESLPEKYYSIPDASVIISEGEELKYFNIQMKNIDENFVDKQYVLPISIKSVDKDVTINEDQKVVIFQFARYRNMYEAKYYAYGTVLGTTNGESITIDEELTATTVDANTIEIEGAESGMYLYLTVSDENVEITGGTGSDVYVIKNTSGTISTYSGQYNETYKCNEGVFNLYYTYTSSAGEEMKVSVSLKFWL